MQAKFIKLAGISLTRNLTWLINECISTSTFPSDMKMAEICPVFKKNDSLLKENYRSINILPIVSKLFEKLIATQLMEYFNGVINPSVSAHGKGYSCQHALLQLT